MLAPKESNTLNKWGKPCLWFCSDQTGAAEDLLKIEYRNTKMRHITEFMRKTGKV
jgi:hypothetical protein